MASPSTPLLDPLAEALRENQELRNALAQLRAENLAQAAAVDAASEQLQQFLYAASHDLQEPLRGIITYAQLLDRQLSADPASQEYSAFIAASALRMRELLQQLLVYSRAGSAKKRTAFNLNISLQMALLKLSAEITASGAKIVRHALPDIVGNETELSQVFGHVLSNSIRFRSQSAPEIVISSEQGTDQCTISVQDNGLGIDPRFCEQALLPFKRLHANEISGNGLGLAICCKIVSAHQGRLWIESDGANGATVRFTLPT